jgi:hypothetical protein
MFQFRAAKLMFQFRAAKLMFQFRIVKLNFPIPPIGTDSQMPPPPPTKFPNNKFPGKGFPDAPPPTLPETQFPGMYDTLNLHWHDSLNDWTPETWYPNSPLPLPWQWPPPIPWKPSPFYSLITEIPWNSIPWNVWHPESPLTWFPEWLNTWNVIP